MKKTLMMAAAAATMIAAPAFAQTAGTQYSDGISTFDLNASVQNFCRFGSQGNTADNGTGVNSNGNGAATGDQAFNVDIQNTSDNTVKAANGGFNYAEFQCNTLFKVEAVSSSGGLAASYTGPADSAFLRTVPYQVSVGSNGNDTPFQTDVQGLQTLIPSNQPVAGNGRFRFSVPANSGLLLQGTYTDTIVLTMSPVTGSSI